MTSTETTKFTTPRTASTTVISTTPEPTVTKVTTTPETTTLKPIIIEVTTTVEPTVTELTTTPEPTVTEVTTTPEPTVTEVTTTPEPTVTEVTTTPEPTVTEVTTTPEPTVTEVTTTSEMVTTTATAPPDIIVPIEEEESDGIIQISSNVNKTCDDTEPEDFVQDVVIENKYEMDDFEKALHRLKNSKDSYCAVQTVLSQESNSTMNSSWYFMDYEGIIRMEYGEEYQSDVHISQGLLMILPLIDGDGNLNIVILIRIFNNEPASPIVQISQTFADHNNCHCKKRETFQSSNHVADDVSFHLAQHFQEKATSLLNPGRSPRDADTDCLTEYINMLDAVPPFQRTVKDLIIVRELEEECVS
ncbi:basement membrane proteoglycan-like [Penaeus monodon]|uniref:basement membrane proteoglycan-like n=1 Tax=Penaeus monodon TaxID=6687 RepID=UPI0018A76995|nr:basement membrane proteoglycan-like [Penaeus monodon]